MTKKELMEELKENFNTKLERRVLNYVLWDLKNGNYEGYTFQDRFFNCVYNFASHPCSTGICNDLIYYNQTERWFNRYKKEILNTLQEWIDEGCFKIEENYDGCYYFIKLNNNTMIKLDYNNQIKQKQFDSISKNDLAWFSFEVIANNILNFMECLEY